MQAVTYDDILSAIHHDFQDFVKISRLHIALILRIV